MISAMRWLMLVLVAAVLTACTNEAATRAVLDDSAFTPIEVGGYSWFGCGEDYFYHTKFRATNANGKVVDGVACCGLFKGCSLKF